MEYTFIRLVIKQQPASEFTVDAKLFSPSRLRAVFIGDHIANLPGRGPEDHLIRQQQSQERFWQAQAAPHQYGCALPCLMTGNV